MRGRIAAIVGLLALSAPALARADDPARAGAARLERAPVAYTSEGLRITGLLWKPEGPGPFPLVVVCHGGFEPASSVAGFGDAFAKRGCVALAPDGRGVGGSEGRRELAKGEVADVLNAIRFARSLPYVDGKRVAVWGFSHGGMLGLLAAGRDRSIRGVVALQAPADLAGCYAHWQRNRDRPGIAPLLGLPLLLGGDPKAAPAAWSERSPITVASRIRCPVMLVYSDAEDAVPPDQGKRLLAALRKAGNRRATLTMAPGANHGLDRATWEKVLPEMLNWVDGVLQPGSTRR